MIATYKKYMYARSRHMRYMSINFKFTKYSQSFLYLHTSLNYQFETNERKSIRSISFDITTKHTFLCIYAFYFFTKIFPNFTCRFCFVYYFDWQNNLCAHCKFCITLCGRISFFFLLLVVFSMLLFKAEEKKSRKKRNR